MLTCLLVFVEKQIFEQYTDPTTYYLGRYIDDSQIPWSETLTNPVTNVTDNNQILLVLTFYPFSFKVRDIIRKNFHILKNDPFSNYPLVSFRHSKNIRATLAHSNLRQE